MKQESNRNARRGATHCGHRVDSRKPSHYMAKLLNQPRIWIAMRNGGLRR